MIQGLRCCLVTSWLVPVPCVGDEVRKESIERQQLLQLELVSIERGFYLGQYEVT